MNDIENRIQQLEKEIDQALSYDQSVVHLEYELATQRAAAKMLGVSVGTINLDLNPVQNRTKHEDVIQQKQGLKKEPVQNRTKPLVSITQSGEDAAL